MTGVLSQTELDQSPLADLHAIASELGLEGYRRLRRAELVDAILGRVGGEAPPAPEARAPRPRASSRAPRETPPSRAPRETPPSRAPRDEDDEETRPRRRSSRRRGRSAEADTTPAEPLEALEAGMTDEGARRPEREPEDEDQRDASDEPERVVAGLLDLLPNGSGFLRAGRFAAADDDPYVSPAQIRRCELRSGDEVAGPVRPPRRSERHPSLVRVDTVDGAPAEPPVPRAQWKELTPVWASARLPGPDALDDAPFGRGSRVAITGGEEVGTACVLHAALATLAEREPEIQRIVVLLGALPEEVTEWRRGALGEVAGGAFDEPLEEQVHAAERAVERAKRVAERGGDAVVAVDGLERLPAEVARRVFGAGRRAEEGGSLTVLATLPPGHEVTAYATTLAEIVPGKKGKDPVAGPDSYALRADLLG